MLIKNKIIAYSDFCLVIGGQSLCEYITRSFLVTTRNIVDRMISLSVACKNFSIARDFFSHVSDCIFFLLFFFYPSRLSYKSVPCVLIAETMVVNCSVAERRRRRPLYQTDKTLQVHAKHNTYRDNVLVMVSCPCDCDLVLYARKENSNKIRKDSKTGLSQRLIFS